MRSKNFKIYLSFFDEKNERKNLYFTLISYFEVKETGEKY